MLTVFIAPIRYYVQVGILNAMFQINEALLHSLNNTVIGLQTIF